MEQQNEFVYRRTHADSFLSKTDALNFHYWNKGEVSPHTHEYFEIFLITEGKAEHIWGDSVSTIKRGTLCIIRPNEEHGFLESREKEEPAEHFNIRITASLFQALCALVSPTLYDKILGKEKLVKCKLKKHEFEYFLQLVRSPQFIFKSAEDESAISVVKVIVVNLLLSVRNSLKNTSTYPKWFQNFLDEINSPEAFSLPLSELYKLSGYSQRRLNTYFNEFTGMTLVAYMTKLKIAYACNLLQTTTYTVLQISLMASFNTLCHFNYVFKKTMNMTPTAYREKHKQSAF